MSTSRLPWERWAPARLLTYTRSRAGAQRSQVGVRVLYLLACFLRPRPEKHYSPLRGVVVNVIVHMRSAAYSLVLSFVVLALKGGAYLATGSVALYSDALESTINVVAAATALTALWVSRKPA